MLIFLSIVGIILSVLLIVFNIRRNQSIIYLSIFFFLVSIYEINIYVLLYSKSVFLVSVFLLFIPLFGSLTFLIGPMLYLYFRSVLSDDSKFKKKDIWHLVPMAIFFVVSLPLMFTSWYDKVSAAKELVKDVVFLQDYQFNIFSELFSVHAVALCRTMLVLLYTIFSILLLIRYLIRRKELFVFSRKHLMIKWLSVLIIVHSIWIFSHFLNMVNPVSVFMTMNTFHILSLAGLLGLLILPFFFPSILYGLPRFKEIFTLLKTKEREQGVMHNEQIHNTNHFEGCYLLMMQQKADSCMAELKPYLIPDCNLYNFSVLIRIPSHHLAYYFREVKKQHFNDYRNYWRVSHAKNLIREGKLNELTIEAIGFLSGFSTRNTFLTSFKKVEGITPSEYAARIKKSALSDKSFLASFS